MANLKIELMNTKSLPKFFYGTAWKEERTEEYTLQALRAGFRAIDTANQRKHYFEEGVGNALQQFLKTKSVSPSTNATATITREDLFLQTKFTFTNGQDHRKPYNEKDSFTQQVQDSFASSLKHLNTTYLDSYVLHGPYTHHSITETDLETWSAMEQLYQDRKMRYLGISNVSVDQLMELCQKVKIKPQFVQNRCFARMGWDKEVRELCKDQNIQYQGFSLLTANIRELSSPFFHQLSVKYKKTIPQIVFRFSQQLGMVALTGSTNLSHLTQDLDIDDFELNPTEMNQIESISS